MVGSLHCHPAILSSLSTAVLFLSHSVSFMVDALVDSSSAGNFISQAFCQKLRLWAIHCSTAHPIHSVVVSGYITHQTKPVNLQAGTCHSDCLPLLILKGSMLNVILRQPWLVQHSLVVDWISGEINVSRAASLFRSGHMHNIPKESISWPASHHPYCIP